MVPAHEGGYLTAAALFTFELDTERWTADRVKRWGGRVAWRPGGSVFAVWLGATKVTDSDLKTLSALTHLEILDLSGTKVTNAGLKDLVTLRHLRWLNLRGTQVTDAGMRALRKALPSCRIQH
jgi:hypothetical protein